MADDNHHDEPLTPEPIDPTPAAEETSEPTREYGARDADVGPTRVIDPGAELTREHGAATNEPTPDAAMASTSAPRAPLPSRGPVPPTAPPMPQQAPNPAWAGAGTATKVREREPSSYQEPVSELPKDSTGRGLRITIVLVAVFTVLAVLALAAFTTTIGALSRTARETVELPAGTTSLTIDPRDSDVVLNVSTTDEGPARVWTQGYGIGEVDLAPIDLRTSGDASELSIGAVPGDDDEGFLEGRLVFLELPRSMAQELDLSVGSGLASLTIGDGQYGALNLGDARWEVLVEGSAESLTVDAPNSFVNVQDFGLGGPMDIQAGGVDVSLDRTGLGAGPITITAEDDLALALPRAVDPGVFAIDHDARYQFRDARRPHADGVEAGDGEGPVAIRLTGGSIRVADVSQDCGDDHAYCSDDEVYGDEGDVGPGHGQDGDGGGAEV